MPTDDMSTVRRLVEDIARRVCPEELPALPILWRVFEDAVSSGSWRELGSRGGVRSPRGLGLGRGDLSDYAILAIGPAVQASLMLARGKLERGDNYQDVQEGMRDCFVRFGAPLEGLEIMEKYVLSFFDEQKVHRRTRVLSDYKEFAVDSEELEALRRRAGEFGCWIDVWPLNARVENAELFTKDDREVKWLFFYLLSNLGHRCSYGEIGTMVWRKDATLTGRGQFSLSSVRPAATRCRAKFRKRGIELRGVWSSNAEGELLSCTFVGVVAGLSSYCIVQSGYRPPPRTSLDG